MNLIRFIILFFLFNLSNANGQKYELGKVTKDELSEKFHRDDSSTVAAIKFKKAKTTFNYSEKNGFVSSTEFQIKLKVYKKEGTTWANFDIPYYIGYEKLNDEYIDIVSAYSYNLEGNQIVKTKIDGQGKFKNVINEYWAKKTITFPNVKEGSIIELNYKLKTQNLSLLPEFQFQYDIPVDYAEFQTLIPEYYIYKGIKSGYADIDVVHKIEQTSQSFTKDVKYEHTGDYVLSYKQVNSIYKAKNIKAIKKEAFTNNIENHYGKINHELETVRMPNEKPKQISTTWEDVAKSIYDDDKFGKEIRKYNLYINDLNLLIKDKTDPNDRMNIIYNYVKSKMNWDGYYGYYTKKGVEKAYKEKTGNAAEINFILLSMLKISGIESYPVLINTRENSVALFPNKSMFNYVIVAVISDGKTVLIDATDKNSDFNILPIRCLNSTGRMIKDDGSSQEINLTPKTNSLKATNLMAEIFTNGDVKGKIRQQHFNHNAYLYRDKNNGISKESIIEKMEQRFTGVEVADYEVLNNTDLTKPIIENYTFTSNNLVEIIDNTIYMSPMLFFAITENPFKQEKREYPVDFLFPFQEKYNISITIPDGYTIETLPESKAIAMPDNLGKFSYNISKNNNQAQLVFSFEINEAVISPEYYEVLKNFFKEVINKQNEKIILKKS